MSGSEQECQRVENVEAAATAQDVLTQYIYEIPRRTAIRVCNPSNK